MGIVFVRLWHVDLSFLKQENEIGFGNSELDTVLKTGICTQIHQTFIISLFTGGLF